MKKYVNFVFSDVHGEYNALMDSLAKAGYDKHNPDHRLISLGDNFDRGKDSAKVWRFLCQAKNKVLIKGNHETFLSNYLEYGTADSLVIFNILNNGLGATIKSFGGKINNDIYRLNDLDEIRLSINRNETLKDDIDKMPLYFETQNFIFCHAGLDPSKNNWKDTSEEFILWDIEHSADSIYTTNKKVVIGHHHADKVRYQGILRGTPDCGVETCSTPFGKIKVYGGESDCYPYYNGCNKIAIDTKSNITHKVNVLVIEDYDLEPPTENEIKTDGTTIKVSMDNEFKYFDLNLDNNTFTTTTNFGTMFR